MFEIWNNFLTCYKYCLQGFGYFAMFWNICYFWRFFRVSKIYLNLSKCFFKIFSGDLKKKSYKLCFSYIKVLFCPLIFQPFLTIFFLVLISLPWFFVTFATHKSVKGSIFMLFSSFFEGFNFGCGKNFDLLLLRGWLCSAVDFIGVIMAP